MGYTRRPVVAVSGSPGSGKTTYAKFLADKLGLRLISGGHVFREMAKERGLSLLELNRLAMEDAGVDLELERRLYQEALNGGVVVESHLAGWTLRGVADVTIYVKASIKERIRRIAKREGREQTDVLKETLWREVLEAQRFRRLYAIDVTDLNHFDIVLDTTFLDEEEAKELLLSYCRAVLRRKGYQV